MTSPLGGGAVRVTTQPARSTIVKSPRNNAQTQAIPRLVAPRVAKVQEVTGPPFDGIPTLAGSSLCLNNEPRATPCSAGRTPAARDLRQGRLLALARACGADAPRETTSETCSSCATPPRWVRKLAIIHESHAW